MKTLQPPKGQLHKRLAAKRRSRISSPARTHDNPPLNPPEKSIWFLVLGSLGLTALVVLALNTSAFTRTLNSARSTDSRTPTIDAPSSPVEPALPSFHRTLNGSIVASPELQNPQLVAVSIDNMLEGRPSSGIDQALWIFEFPAEATITRFLGIFDVGQTVNEIGPVRSVRPYMVDLAQSLGAVLTHSGGSPVALKILSQKNAKTRSINEFSQTPYFWRDQDRPGPHNLYTATERLRIHPYLSAPSEATLAPLVWADPVQNNTSLSTNNQRLTIAYPEPYTARWQYDAGTQQFQRVNAQGVQEKTRSGALIAADTVVVQFTDVKILDAIGRRSIRSLGEGEAMVVSRGTMELARWSRKNPGDRTTLMNVLGEPLPINPGKIWWTIVPKATAVSFE